REAGAQNILRVDYVQRRRPLARWDETHAQSRLSYLGIVVARSAGLGALRRIVTAGGRVKAREGAIETAVRTTRAGRFASAKGPVPATSKSLRLDARRHS